MDEEPQHFKIAGFTIFSNFECGNLGYVELAGRGISGMFRKHIRFTSPNFQRKPDFEFDIWTNRDCEGTDYENGNRTWFCFGVGGGPPGALVQFNMMNLNRQKRLFAQGMNPVYMIIPTQPWWDRVPGKPMFETLVGNFFISFMFRMPTVPDAETYFAFTFPHNYAKLQSILLNLDKKHSHIAQLMKNPSSEYKPGIYYHRELMCYSPDGLRVDLLTVTSSSGMDNGTEDPFGVAKFDSRDGIPIEAKSRPKKFPSKPVVFITSRVHPGEVQSSFVFNGFLKFILSDDPRAKHLREHFVFKLVPFLNPDGVVRGHFRTDYRGVNLNRVYHNPCPVHHPSIYAMKRVFLYHAFKDKAVLRAALAAESPYTFVPPPDRTTSGADRPFLIDETTRDALDVATGLTSIERLIEQARPAEEDVRRDEGGMDDQERATEDAPLRSIQASGSKSLIPTVVPRKNPEIDDAFENAESHKQALFRLRLMRSITGQDKKKPKTSVSEGASSTGVFDHAPALNALLKDRIQVQDPATAAIISARGVGGGLGPGGGGSIDKTRGGLASPPPQVIETDTTDQHLHASDVRMASSGFDGGTLALTGASVSGMTFNGSVKKIRRSIPAYFNSERMWPAKLPEKNDSKLTVKQKVNAFKFGFGFRAFTSADCRCPGTTTKWSAPSDPPSPTPMRAGQDVLVDDSNPPPRKPEPVQWFNQDSDSCGASSFVSRGFSGGNLARRGSVVANEDSVEPKNEAWREFSTASSPPFLCRTQDDESSSGGLRPRVLPEDYSESCQGILSEMPPPKKVEEEPRPEPGGENEDSSPGAESRMHGGGGVASSELGGDEDAMADNAAINLFRLPHYFSNETDDGKGSGVFAYVDLHGHASKRGTFFYGNHIDNLDAAVETLLLPKILSINCPYFDFDACNFSKANTQARGYSKAGSGRVFFHKATANARCYTLECNYNSGFYKYNPPPLPGTFPGKVEKEKIRYDPEWTGKVVRYNPVIFREVGQALAISLLDMIGKNPYSRLPQSEFGDVHGVREWLRDYLTSPLPPVSASQYPEVAHVFGPITPPPPTLTKIAQLLFEPKERSMVVVDAVYRQNMSDPAVKEWSELRQISWVPRWRGVSWPKNAFGFGGGKKGNLQQRIVLTQMLPHSHVKWIVDEYGAQQTLLKTSGKYYWAGNLALSLGILDARRPREGQFRARIPTIPRPRKKRVRIKVINTDDNYSSPMYPARVHMRDQGFTRNEPGEGSQKISVIGMIEEPVESATEDKLASVSVTSDPGSATISSATLTVITKDADQTPKDLPTERPSKTNLKPARRTSVQLKLLPDALSAATSEDQPINPATIILPIHGKHKSYFHPTSAPMSPIDSSISTEDLI